MSQVPQNSAPKDLNLSGKNDLKVCPDKILRARTSGFKNEDSGQLSYKPFIGCSQALWHCVCLSLLAAAKLLRLGNFLWAPLSRRILSSLHREPERRKRNAHCAAFRQSLHCLIAEH